MKNYSSSNIKGAVLFEYALVAALIAVVGVTSLTSLGTALVDKFNAIAASLGSGTKPTKVF